MSFQIGSVQDSGYFAVDRKELWNQGQLRRIEGAEAEPVQQTLAGQTVAEEKTPEPIDAVKKAPTDNGLGESIQLLGTGIRAPYKGMESLDEMQSFGTDKADRILEQYQYFIKPVLETEDGVVRRIADTFMRR